MTTTRTPSRIEIPPGFYKTSERTLFFNAFDSRPEGQSIVDFCRQNAGEPWCPSQPTASRWRKQRAETASNRPPPRKRKPGPKRGDIEDIVDLMEAASPAVTKSEFKYYEEISGMSAATLRRRLKERRSAQNFDTAVITSREEIEEVELRVNAAIARTALLIIDMQNMFQEMAVTTIPHIRRLHRLFENTAKANIIFTQHGHTQEELTPPFKNQLIQNFGPEHSIAEGSKEWEFLPEIRKLVRRSPIVAKNTHDAFLNTNLADLLENRQVDRVLICGVMTECSCDTTGRSAFNRGYETWLISDACGSANEMQHQIGLNAFGFACRNAVTTDEAISKLESGE